MKPLALVLLAAILGVSVARAQEVSGSRDKSAPPACQASIADGILEVEFPGLISHAIHSISLEKLQEFDSSASAINRVPVVNPDLLSGNPILANAPSLNLTNHFMTPAMQLADAVLSHIDDPHYGMGAYDSLERLMHALHMDEVWHTAKIAYNKLVETEASRPPETLCTCLRDVESNGVLVMLRFIALQIREPELMLGKHVTINGRQFQWSGNLYRYGFLAQDPVFGGEAFDGSDPLPPLKNEKAWKAWKGLMGAMKHQGSETVANFLYCALHG